MTTRDGSTLQHAMGSLPEVYDKWEVAAILAKLPQVPWRAVSNRYGVSVAVLKMRVRDIWRMP